jgi:hypothetical protein
VNCALQGTLFAAKCPSGCDCAKKLRIWCAKNLILLGCSGQTESVALRLHTPTSEGKSRLLLRHPYMWISGVVGGWFALAGGGAIIDCGSLG